MTPSSFDVLMSGGGPPMVLVPGAACDAAVWDGAVVHFGERYELHRIQLAGFCGRPRVATPLVDTARRELAAYLRELPSRPVVLVGHSLGAFLTYAVAAEVPRRVGAAIAIDGVPALGRIIVPRGSPAEVERMAQWRRRRLANLSPQQFRTYLAGAFGSMVVEPSAAVGVIERGSRSDPGAVADAMYELWTTDLRPLLPAIRAPLLFVAPEWGGVDATRSAVRLALFERQLSAIPEVRTVVIEAARHFVMLDQPAALFAEMDRFLEGVSLGCIEAPGRTR